MAKQETGNRRIFGEVQGSSGSRNPQAGGAPVPMPDKRPQQQTQPKEQPQTGKAQGAGVTLNYRLFPSLWAFDKAIDLQLTSSNNIPENKSRWKGIVNDADRRYNDSQWWGSPAPNSFEEIANHDTFLWMDRYKQIRSQVKDKLKKLRKLKAESEVKVNKLSWNALELGMFSFDRAAVGLFKTKTKEGEVKLTTSKEDVYAYFDPRTQTRRTLKIYILVGGNMNLSGDQLINVGVSAAILAEELEKLAVLTELNLILGTQTSGNAYAGIINVKKFDGQLKLNDMLVLASSPRYFRFKGFKGIIGLYDFFKEVAPSGLGSMPSQEMIAPALKSINRKPYIPHVLLSHSYSQNDAVEEIQRILDIVESNPIFKQND